jgi:hypothetical protein
MLLRSRKLEETFDILKNKQNGMDAGKELPLSIDYRREEGSKYSGVRHLRDNFKPQFAFQQCNRGESWNKKLKKSLILLS